jgi:hypothetical protein
VQVVAVKQHGYAIQYIKTPSKAVQFEAVKQDAYAIQFIKKPSDELIIKATKKMDTKITHTLLG